LRKIINVHLPEDCGNAPRKLLLKDFIQTFFAKDEKVFAYLVDDIKWDIVGKRHISGKNDFWDALNSILSDDINELWISNIITHGNTASVNGWALCSFSKFEFCHVFVFTSSNKLKEIKTFLIYL